MSVIFLSIKIINYVLSPITILLALLAGSLHSSTGSRFLLQFGSYTTNGFFSIPKCMSGLIEWNSLFYIYYYNYFQKNKNKFKHMLINESVLTVGEE